jgi:hypothetical protein
VGLKEEGWREKQNKRKSMKANKRRKKVIEKWQVLMY